MTYVLDVSTTIVTHNNCNTHTLSQSKSLQSQKIESAVHSQSSIGKVFHILCVELSIY